MEIKPKFDIGDKVIWRDNFNSNPANKTLLITTIKAIRIDLGKGMFVGSNNRGRIYYDLHGSALCEIKECEIIPYTKAKLTELIALSKVKLS